MAFDPQREDYQRLGLRFAQSLDQSDPARAARTFATFGRRFAHDRDSLPQSDADRAFHLVAMATRLIDYELPFATDDQANELIDSGHRLLDEALTLDAHCYDALRMKASADCGSFEAFLAYLHEHAPEVREHCEQRRAQVGASSGERNRLAADIAMRPYLRWIASQAELALICGRNREALRLAHECLDLDAHDGADARFTAALAYAKLEDEEGLDALQDTMRARGMVRPASDAWMLLARLALAHKRYDLDAARHWLESIIASYPHAAEALIRQTELPDGVFSRLAAVPYSEDELIIALSEGTVLLQEGVDPHGRGVLSTWVIHETALRHPKAMLTVIAADNAADARGSGASADPDAGRPS